MRYALIYLSEHPVENWPGDFFDGQNQNPEDRWTADRNLPRPDVMYDSRNTDKSVETSAIFQAPSHHTWQVFQFLNARHVRVWFDDIGEYVASWIRRGQSTKTPSQGESPLFRVLRLFSEVKFWKKWLKKGEKRIWFTVCALMSVFLSNGSSKRALE